MRTCQLLLILFCCGIAHAAVPTSAPAEVSDRQRLHASDLARQALDFIAQGKYPQAEKSLREALEIVPNKATWVYNLACVLSLRDEPNAAMDCLEQAADLGFTDFTQMERDPYLITVRALPRYQKLIERKEQIRHHAADLAVEELKNKLGPKYLYEADEEHKLIFAAATDQATLDALKESLLKQAASQWDALFSHKPDEFIRIVVPTPVDFRRLVRNYAASGIYLDESRMLVAPHLGQVVVHEFTHALHAADQRAVGQEHPVWLREGLASMYEAGEFEKDVLQPRDNYRLAFVQSAARRQALVPLDRLLKYTPQDFVSHSNLAYGESSSLLLYLYQKQQLRPFYDQYKKDYVSDPSGSKTLEKITGLSLAELQKQWSAWMIDRPVPVQQPPAGGAWIGANFTAATDGLAVGVVFPNGPAANSGLKPGDVLVGIDDRDVRDTQTLIPLLAAHQPGDLVIVKIRRGETYVKAPLVLGKR
ncbi:MAG TPA: PDZ domain-containing protein [Humisphaera sp.]|nr:PDZ domain-containing protein [Humisphaera sp.]